MGITSSLYVALTGMNMSQAAMNVASQNMANVNTPGYSRQRINLAALSPWGSSWGQMGTGVTANSISRYHDQFLTRNLIDKTADLGRYEAQKQAADVLESYFNETQGSGINELMSDFWASWERIADNPNSNPPREELIGRAGTLASQIKSRRADMDSLKEDINARLVDSAHVINKALKELAALNDQIMWSESPDRLQQANDLRDTREELLRQVSDLIEIQYYEDPQNGTINVTTPKGTQLVLGTQNYVLKAERDSNNDTRLTWVSPRNERIEVADGMCGGRVGGWIEYRDETMPDFYMQLDSFTDNLIFQANNQHAQGVGQNLYTETYSTSNISNNPAYDIPFPGDDNDIRITSLVTWQEQTGPYDPQKDPENISIRFEKSSVITSKITSSVAWNNAPGVQKWEITIVLPKDSNGNVTATSDDIAEYINCQRSATPGTGVDQLPPVVAWPAKVGDFISATVAKNNSGNKTANIYGNSNPPGTATFYTLDRDLKHMLPQGEHLSYGFENAQLQTTIRGDDNDILFQSIDGGAVGENISIEYANSGAPNSPLTINVVAGPNGESHIVVNLATNAAGEVTSTAGDIVATINSNAQTRLLVTARTPTGESGLGLVEEMPQTFLDRSGFFNIVTYGADGEANFHRITVDPTDTLDDVVKQIGDTFTNGIPGLRVEVLTDDRGQNTIRILADTDSGVSYGFANDNSGALAVLGLNNLFTGSDSTNISVNQAIINNRLFLAAGKIGANGVIKAGDNTNALDMADLKNQDYSFYHLTGNLDDAFNGLYGSIGSTNQAITRNHDFTQYLVTQLTDQKDAVSAVNLDEEVADIMRFQYMYQAAAKMISTIDEMMATLLAIR